MTKLLLAILLLSGNLLYSQVRTYEQGEWRLKLGLPYVNNFNLNPEDESRKTQTGWVGFEGGIEYQYSPNNFLTLEYSVNSAAEALGLMDIEGEFDQYTTQSVNLSNSILRDRFSFGYGISFAQNVWNYTRTFIPDSVAPSRDLVNRKSKNIGLIINTYYRIGNSFHIGLIYRPYFWKFDPKTSFDYEHVISLDLMWKIRIVK
jgi:hypothetical protein